VIGPTFAVVASAVCTEGEKDKMLIFTMAATAPIVTQPFKKYCYGNAPTAENSAEAIVKLMGSMGDKKNIGVVIDSSLYGDAGLEMMEKALAASGSDMKITATATIAADGIDGTSQIQKMKSAGVDAVVMAAVPTPGTAVLKAAHQQDLGVPLFSFGGVFLPATAELVTSDAPIEFYLTSPVICPMFQYGEKCGQEVVEKFGGPDHPGYGLFSYYPTKAFFEALKRAKSTEPDDVIATLDSAPPFENDFTVPLKYTPDNHHGLDEQFLEGYKDGELYFFGNDINENMYTP
jgi:branched-chain amino acid transport system substrate-binding protein